MKKTILRITSACLLGLAVGLVARAIKARAQQVVAQSVNTINVPPVTWMGSNAQNITVQALHMTNLDGSLLIPTNFFSGSGVIVIRVKSDTNGVVQSLTATMHPLTQ